MLQKLSIGECRRFLNKQSPKDYPKLYPFIKFYVDEYDNYRSQYVIKDNRKY